MFFHFQVGQITINSSASVLLLAMVSFSVSSITLAFLISTLFSQANLAAACGAVIFFLTYIPYIMAYAWDSLIPLSAKLVLVSAHTRHRKYFLNGTLFFPLHPLHNNYYPCSKYCL